MSVAEMITNEVRTASVHTDQSQEALIKEYVVMIQYHASRLAAKLPAYLDADDLFIVGTMGLMDAVNRFDPKRETKLKTYAKHRILGAMLDEIRAMGWMPRSVRTRRVTLQRATESLQQKLGRPATESEIGAVLGLLPDKMSDFLVKAQGVALVSMDQVDTQDEDQRNLRECLPQPEVADQLAVMIDQDHRGVLAAAIEELPERERLVLRLYYYEEMTMKEVGKALSASESRIWQLREQAVSRLKTSLAGSGLNG